MFNALSTLIPFPHRDSREDTHQRILSYSADELWKSGCFWRRQWQLILIGVAALAATLIVWPWTAPRSDHIFSYLVLIIYSLTFWGLWHATSILAQIELEHTIVGEVERRGREKLSAIRADPAKRIDLDTLEENLIPHARGASTPAMVQMFQHICQDAGDHSFESRTTIIHPYRENLLGEVLALQNIIKIALRLGILGTFLGLLVAIHDLSELMKNSAIATADNGVVDAQALDLFNLGRASFAAVAPDLFNALRISFGTSVAGLLVSIILGAATLLIHKRQEKYFKDMEDAAGTALSLARKADNQDSFFVEFRQIRNAMDQLQDRIYQQTQSVSENFHYVGERLIDQAGDFEKGIDQLKSVREEWNRFLGDMRDAQRQLVEGFDASKNTIVEQFGDFLITFAESKRLFLEDMRGAYRQIIKDVNAEQNGASEQFQGFLHNLGESQQRFLADAEKTLDILSVGKLGPQLSESIGEAGRGIASTLRPELDRLSGQMSELTLASRGLQDINGRGIGDLDQLNSGLERLLTRMDEIERRFSGDAEIRQTAVAAVGHWDSIRREIANIGRELSSSTAWHLEKFVDEIHRIDSSLGEYHRETLALSRKTPKPLFRRLAGAVGLLFKITGGLVFMLAVCALIYFLNKSGYLSVLPFIQ